MNYIHETLLFHAQTKREEHTSLLEQMAAESYCILEDARLAIDAFEFVQEAAKKRGSILDRIKDFFKRLFDAFVGKVRSLSRSNKQWWINNEDKIKNADFKGLSVETYPYLPESANMVADLGIIQGRVQKELTRAKRDPESKNGKGDDELKKLFLSNYLDENGEFVNGMKNFYRSNKKSTNEAKPVKYEGEALKTFLMGHARVTVLKYDATENTMRKFLTQAERNIANLERELDKRTAPEKLVEHFSVLEENFWVLTEDTQPATKPNTEVKKEEPKKDETKPDTEVKRSGLHKGEVTRHDAASMTNRQLAIVMFAARTYQQLFSVILTIMEEQTMAYMKIARSALKSAGAPETTEKTKDEKKA